MFEHIFQRHFVGFIVDILECFDDELHTSRCCEFIGFVRHQFYMHESIISLVFVLVIRKILNEFARFFVATHQNSHFVKRHSFFVKAQYLLSQIIFGGESFCILS